MRISLASHGGWSAPLRRPPLTLDTAGLPEAAAAELAGLAKAAEAAAASAPATEAATESAGPSPRAPEAMTYAITIERDGKQVTLRGSDLEESPEFAALRDWLQAQATAQAGGS
ncbi:MAG: protealysin inhibitor emfourin [Allosphingosinicella sp.]